MGNLIDRLREEISQGMTGLREFLSNADFGDYNNDSQAEVSNWFKTPSGEGTTAVNVDPLTTADLIIGGAAGKVPQSTAQKAKETGRQEFTADQITPMMTEVEGRPRVTVDQTGTISKTRAELTPDIKVSTAGYDMDRRRATERLASIENELTKIVNERALLQNPYATVENQQEYDYKTGTYKPVTVSSKRSLAELEAEEDKLIKEKAEIDNQLANINYKATQAKYANYDSKEDFNVISRADAAVQDDTYRYINDIDGFRASAGKEVSDKMATSANDGVAFVETPEYANHFYEYMTEDEVKRYNYIYKKEGASKAQDYLDEIETSVLAPRYRREQYTQNKEYAEKHPVLGTAATFGSNLIDTILAPAKIASTIGGDYNTRLDMFTNFTGDVRGTVTENIDNPVGKLAYQATTSIVDMGVALGIGVATGGWGSKAAGTVTQLIMSSSAASSTLTEANARGLDPWQSLSLATAAGVIECITEKYSIEALFSKPQSVAGYIAKNMMAEGSEEIASEVANNMVDLFISGDKAKMNQRVDELILEGKTTKEASQIALGEHLKDVGYAGILGAVTGGIFGGVGSVKNASTLSYGKKITALEGGTEKLIKVSNELSADEPLIAAVLSKFVEEAREKPTSRAAAGELAQAVLGQMKYQLNTAATNSRNETKVTQVETHIKELLESNGLETVFSDKLSKLRSAAAVDVGSKRFAKAAFGGNKDNEIYAAELSAVSEELGAKGFDNETFLNILQINPDVDVSKAKKSFMKAYFEGYTAAVTLEESQRNDQTLLDEQVAMAYNAGKAFADAGGKFSPVVQAIVDGSVAEVKNDASEVKSSNSINVKKGRVVYEESVDLSNLSDKQKAQIKYIEVVAAVTGVEIHLFQSGLNSEGRYDVPYNGKFNRETNTIDIDVNAGKLGENIGDYALTRTLSHELTHFIRMNAPQEYMALMRFCFQKIGMDEFSRLAESKTANNESLDFEDAIEEVVASGCEMVLRDSNAIEQLAKENRSLAEKILDFLKNFAQKVKAAFEGVNAVSYEAKQLEAYADELVELWDSALKKAVQNNISNGDSSAMGVTSTQNSAAETQQDVSDSQEGAAETQQETSEAEQNVSAEEQDANSRKYKNIPDAARSKGRDLSEYLDNEGDVMFEERDYSYDALVAKPDMPLTLVKQEAITTREDIINAALSNVKDVGYTNENGNAVVRVKDISTDVIVPKRSFVHGLDRRISTQAPVLRKIGNILQNSIRMNELIPRTENISKSYVLVGAAVNENNEPYVVSFVVNRYSNEVSAIDVLYSENAKKEPAAFLPKITDESATPTGSAISISDLLEYVNKYFPDILPESVLRHFGHTVRPEGVLGESTLYEDRTAELTDEQVIEQRLKHLKETDPEFQKLKRYSKISSKMARNTREQNRVKRELNKINERLSDKIDTEPEEQQSLNDRAVELRRVLARLQSWYNEMKTERQELYKDSQIEKIIEAERREMSRVAFEEYQKDVDNYRAARNKTETLNKIRRLRNILATMLNANTQKKHVPIPLMKTVLNLLSDISDTKAADREITDKLQSFRDKYEHIADDENAGQLLKEIYDEDLFKRIGAIKEAIQGKNLSELTNADLNRLYDITQEVYHAVTNVNKLHGKELNKNREEAADSMLEQLQEHAKENKFVLALRKSAAKFKWELYKPLQFIEKMGSDVLRKLYDNLRGGEDVYYRHITKAKEFKQQTAEKYGIKNKDLEVQHEFRIGNDSETVTLTVGQMMDIYVYGKRAQAKGHLLEGGFYYPDGVRKTQKGVITYEMTDTNGHRLTEKEIETISNSLTEKQRGYADAMQRYLAKNMGALGNAVTLKLNGVAKFTDWHYFPILTAQDYVMQQEGKAPAIPSLASPGFAHDLVKGANNPIVLDNFNDMWGRHVSQMAMYNAFAVPLSDFTKVTNWQFKEGTEDENGNIIEARHDSLQATIENIYGKGAKEYLNRFIDDLNGGIVTDDVRGVDKLLSKFKKAKTFLSASVFVQQFSAIARVMPYLGPVDTAKTFFKGKWTKTWNELVEYCPIAGIKDMGYYDMGVGRSAVDYILADKISPDDVFSYPAAMADRVTWCWIWSACKSKAARQNNTAVNSEETKQAAVKLFNEVIKNTQVYDSVFSRSQIMRRKGVMTKMATAFMAEPMTSLNMLMKSIDRLKQNNSKENWVFFTKTLGALVSNALLNSLLYSLVAAARDDDDEEMSYWEKYAGNVAVNSIDNLLPHNWIPIVRDVHSIFRGYDVKRTDVSLFDDLATSVQNLFSENVSTVDKIFDFAGSIADFTGVPVSNVYRDCKAVVNIINRKGGTTLEGMFDSVALELNNYSSFIKKVAKLPSKTDMYYSNMYKAVVSGDKEEYSRIFGELEQSGKSSSEIKSGLKTYLGDHDDRIAEGHEYYAQREAADEDSEEYTAADDNYNRIVDELVDSGFSVDIVVGAITGYTPDLSKEEEAAEEELTKAADKKAEEYTEDIYSLAIYKILSNDGKTDVIENVSGYAEAEQRAASDKEYEMSVQNRQASIAQSAGISPAEYFAVLESAVSNLQRDKMRAVNESDLSDEEKVVMRRLVKSDKGNLDFIEEYVRRNF